MDRVREKAVVSHRAIEIRKLPVHPFVLSCRGSSQQSKWRLLLLDVALNIVAEVESDSLQPQKRLEPHAWVRLQQPQK